MIIQCLFGSIWSDHDCSIVITDCTFNTDTREVLPDIFTGEFPKGGLIEEYISICKIDLPFREEFPLLLSIHSELDKLISAIMSDKRLTNFDDAVLEVCENCHNYIKPCPECND